MGGRVDGRGICDRPLDLVSGTDPFSKSHESDLDDCVVPPLQEWVCHPIGQPHGSLHHLDRPGYFDARAGLSSTELKARLPRKVAVYQRFDAPRWLALHEFDLDAHPIGHRWSNHTMEHSAPLQRSSLEAKLLQPGPPRFELVDLSDDVPELLWGNRKLVVAPIGHDRPTGHATERYRFSGAPDICVGRARRIMYLCRVAPSTTPLNRDDPLREFKGRLVKLFGQLGNHNDAISEPLAVEPLRSLLQVSCVPFSGERSLRAEFDIEEAGNPGDVASKLDMLVRSLGPRWADSRGRTPPRFRRGKSTSRPRHSSTDRGC